MKHEVTGEQDKRLFGKEAIKDALKTFAIIEYSETLGKAEMEEYVEQFYQYWIDKRGQDFIKRKESGMYSGQDMEDDLEESVIEDKDKLEKK